MPIIEYLIFWNLTSHTKQTILSIFVRSSLEYGYVDDKISNWSKRKFKLMFIVFWKNE